MSWFSYKASQRVLLECDDFYALVMAAMRKADTGNMAKLAAAFPETAAELRTRYDAPGGYLPSEEALADAHLRFDRESAQSTEHSAAGYEL